MKQLKGRVAVVTGAASGIGLAIADSLSGEGVKVVMTDLDPSALGKASEPLLARGSQIETMQLDVRDSDAVWRVAQETTSRFGCLHIAVNNAGIVNRGFTWELPLEEWHRVLDVNLWGVIHGIRAFVPHILATGEEGHVVNVASMAAVLPQERLGPYTVAKHGVLGLSDVLRAEFDEKSSDIGVSVVMPGKIRTGMNPIGSVEPSTVAANVIDAIRRNRPYVFTDDHSVEPVNARLRALIAARHETIPAHEKPE